MTVNGGFSWLRQTLMVPAGVSSSSSAAMVLSNPTVIPTFFDIQFNRNHNLNSTVWAVGDNLASLTLPLTATSYPVCYSVFVCVAQPPARFAQPNPAMLPSNPCHPAVL